MSTSKEAWWDLMDDLERPEPMHPIRFEYLTTTRDLAVQTDMLERLGLVYVFVGRNLFALNECDSNSLRLSAREQLEAEGLANEFITTHVMTRRTESLLRQLVIQQAGSVAHTALRDPSRVDRLAQELRAQADADLAAHGVDLKARLAHAVAESEAA